VLEVLAGKLDQSTLIGQNGEKWRKRMPRLRRGQVGVLLDGATEIKFFEWWLLAPYLTVDFARLLGKGSNYRVRVRRSKGLDFKPTGHDPQMFEYIKRETGEDVITKSWQREAWLQSHLLNSVISQLSDRWVIRKEDHSTRFVLAEKAWERTQFKEVCKELNLEELGPGVNQKYVYLNPKIKPDKVPGRPIVSFHKVKKGMRSSCRWLTKTIREWSIGKGMGSTSTRQALHRVIPIREGSHLLGGDIKQLFTSVRQKILLKWLEEEIPNAVEMVSGVMSSEISFDGKIYRNHDGLCMGSPYSPILSEFYLTKIETMVPGLCGSRYVDDFVIKGTDLADVEQQRQLYEAKLGEANLRVTWEGDNASCPFLDGSLRVGHWAGWGMAFSGKPTNIVKEQLPMSVFRNTVVGEIRRRRERCLYSQGDSYSLPTLYRQSKTYQDAVGNFGVELDLSRETMFHLEVRAMEERKPRKRSTEECTHLNLTWLSYYDSRKGKKALAKCIAAIRKNHPFSTILVRWKYPGALLRCLLTSRTLQKGVLQRVLTRPRGGGRNG